VDNVSKPKRGTVIGVRWDGEKYIYTVQLDTGEIIEVEEDKLERE